MTRIKGFLEFFYLVAALGYANLQLLFLRLKCRYLSFQRHNLLLRLQKTLAQNRVCGNTDENLINPTHSTTPVLVPNAN